MKTYFRAAMVAATALLLAACASAPTPTATPAGSMAGMNHGNTTTSANAPFDAMFIDGMIVHHLGAIDMANDG